MTHKVGDFAIYNDGSFYVGSHPEFRISEILKTTEKTVTVRSFYGQGQTRKYENDIFWSGPEAEAKAKLEKLISSVALCKEEGVKSRARMHERNNRIKGAA